MGQAVDSTGLLTAFLFGFMAAVVLRSLFSISAVGQFVCPIRICGSWRHQSVLVLQGLQQSVLDAHAVEPFHEQVQIFLEPRSPNPMTLQLQQVVLQQVRFFDLVICIRIAIAECAMATNGQLLGAHLTFISCSLLSGR